MSDLAHPETIPIQAAQVEPSDVSAARILNRIVGGEDVEQSEIVKLPREPVDWYGFAKTVRGKPAPNREKARDRYIANSADGARLDAAMKIAKQDPNEVEAADADAFSLDLVDTATFFAETYRLDWMARGILVKDQACVFGGPQKTLKTSILIDLAISLASGTDFLGRFAIPEPMTVALISGESGKAVIQANAKQICIERGLPYEAAAAIRWGFKVPKLTEAEHIRVIRKTIEDQGIKVLMLDPLYLTIVSGVAGVDPKDMYQMGPLLSDIAAACLESGATPILCHHFVKKREDPFGPPDMGDLAYAGIGQFMRQWMLTARRERYDAESGLHPLHFHYGGSAGHSGEIHLDIETGRIDENLAGRRWRVQAFSPSESRVQEKAKAAADANEKQVTQTKIKASRKEAAEAGLMEEFLDILNCQPDRMATTSFMKKATGWNGDKVKRIEYLLRDQGKIRDAKVPTKMNGDRVDLFDGFVATGLDALTGGVNA